MNTTFCAVVIWLIGALVSHGDTQSELYSSNHEQSPPTPFPAGYNDYQILPGTVSPSQQYALIYPTRSRLYELHHYGLFLAALQPFRILSRLPLGNSNLAENDRCYFESRWAKDSLAMVMIAGGRWGPERVSVIALRDGRVVKQTELTAKVSQLVQTDFHKSHTSPYNDYYKFVITGSCTPSNNGPKYSTLEGWKLDEVGRVRIDCDCTTDPKNIDPHGWTVHVTALWDIEASRFVQKDFVQVPFTPSAL